MGAGTIGFRISQRPALPPQGMRVGDLVLDPETGERGTVLYYHLGAVCGLGFAWLLAIQFPGIVRVLKADEVVTMADLKAAFAEASAT